MLVLTRHINESILIGENHEICIRVLGIFGNQVKIGVAALKEVPVNRKEICEKMPKNRMISL